MAFLEVRHVSKSFGGVPVLRDVSFSVNRGEIATVIGASGGGKTTLLRCLNRLETPDSGEICIPSGRVGMVFQNFQLFPQYTVRENILLAPRLTRRGTERERSALADSLLACMGLKDRENSYPWQLSGGEQQRCAIARAMALEPEVLCFDEPTSALDPSLVGQVAGILEGLKEKNMAILVVTHDMAFAKRVSDVVLYLKEGSIARQGTPREVFTGEELSGLPS